MFQKLTLHLKELGVFVPIVDDSQCTFAHHVWGLQLVSFETWNPHYAIPGVLENKKLKDSVSKIPWLLPNIKCIYLEFFPVHYMPQQSRHDFCAGFKNMKTLIMKRMSQAPIPNHSFATLPNIRNLVFGTTQPSWMFGVMPEGPNTLEVLVTPHHSIK